MNSALRFLPFALLGLSSCAGVGNYLHSTFTPFGTPNAPQGDELNMQRARGEAAAAPPILSQSGDIWPNRVENVPTLSQVERKMNAPLGTPTGNPHLRNGAASGPERYTGSTSPGSNQPTVPNAPGPGKAVKITPPSLGFSKAPFNVGETLISPNGPAGVVTGNSNGRYMTVAPINGQGGGMLIPSTGGTATLIGPNGQVTTVTGARP